MKNRKSRKSMPHKYTKTGNGILVENLVKLEALSTLGAN